MLLDSEKEKGLLLGSQLRNTALKDWWKIKQLLCLIYITTLLFSFHKWFYLQLLFKTFFVKGVLFSATLSTLFYSEVFLSLHHSSRQQPIPWSPLSVLLQCDCISLPWRDIQKAFVLSPSLCLILLIKCCFIEQLEDFQCDKNKCLCKNLTLKSNRSVQYFEISQLLNNKRKNSNIIKWHLRWRSIFYTYCPKHKKDACTDSGTVKGPQGTRNVYVWFSERRNKL